MLNKKTPVKNNLNNKYSQNKIWPLLYLKDF
jgi:hypothetical protein